MTETKFKFTILLFNYFCSLDVLASCKRMYYSKNAIMLFSLFSFRIMSFAVTCILYIKELRIDVSRNVRQECPSMKCPHASV